MYKTNITLPSDRSALPKPKGYRLLVAIPGIEERTSGGIIRPATLVDKENTASTIGQVISLGDDAYADQAKFPAGPWCQAGDWVVIKSYSGVRLKILEQEYRIIFDDQVEATVSDPSKLERM